MRDIPKFLNDISDKCYFSSDYSNELFLHYLLPKLEKLFFESENGDESEVSKFIHKERRATKGGLYYPFLLITFSLTFVLGFFIFFYILLLNLLKLGQTSNVTHLKSIIVIRSGASLSKLKLQDEFISGLVLADTFFYKNKKYESLYNIGPINSSLLFFTFVKALYCDVKSFLLDVFIFRGNKEKFVIISHYIHRIPFKLLYQVFLDFRVTSSNFDTLVTGEKEDRYALSQRRIGKKRNVLLTCYPHGLEYGFRTPQGIIGDKFYCNTIASKNVLKSLYPLDSHCFVFDKCVARKMLGGSSESSIINGIVFFPESRGVGVNRKVIIGLKNIGIDFEIKLHPLDSITNYNDLVPTKKFSDDLDVSLTGKVCIARKSTVLLEASNRGSIACALLIDGNDQIYAEYLFPSLTSEDIHVFYNFESLKLFLEGNKFVF